ncbi:hypothetical protein SEA_SWITZERLAND_92 [Gordonia phage Switzerland]|nr:hypothetical protein SEA_LOOPER_91 [Gordonia phage Looper]UAJ15582.1 hypothetical protein SEA_BOOHOO_93 [Gordonia Phage Boohoo]UOK18144.1 hypothetical protein SEA_SWITZERLAND_92 [Gordonia phage Switzerland]UVD39840.1 hypothetical protein SEA_ANAYSIA_94 [Gordonia phage Anaysia]WKW87404.1 hypothetical protein SEA_NEBULOSUS_91 [Gordonia phage Nebulosus]
MESRFYMTMIMIEEVLTFSTQDTYQIPMFVNMTVEVDY